METQSFFEDIRRYLALLQHRAWFLILLPLLIGGTAYLLSTEATPIYQASTTVLINEAPATKSTDYSAIITSERLARTYAELMVKSPVLSGVIERMGLDVSVGALKRAIEVRPVRDTQLIAVKVEDTDPIRAALIANSLVTVFAEQNQALQASRYAASKENLSAQLVELDLQIQQTNDSLNDLDTSPRYLAERDRLEAALAQYRQTYASLLQSYEQVRVAEAQSTSNVVAVEEAAPPRWPVRPRVYLNTIISAVVGLVLAIGFVFLSDALDDTVKGPEDIVRFSGLPVLGMIARVKMPEEAPISALEPRSPVTEAFRALRTNIQYAQVDYPINTLLVTSPSPQDGKTTVAANLSVVLAQSGRRVTLVDADLRRPSVHNIFRLSNRKGLTELFIQPGVTLNGALRQSAMAELSVLTSGKLPPNPAELIGSEKMFEILNALSRQTEVVIIDSPPLMAVTDAAVLAPRVDGVLIVVKPGVTKLGACKQVVEQLQHGGANIIGVVLNNVQLKKSAYNYYNGYYYAYQSYYGEKTNGNGRITLPGRKKDKISDHPSQG